MVFIKTGMRPREFVEMDNFEKAAVIGFIQQYAKDKNDGLPKKPGHKGKRSRRK